MASDYGQRGQAAMRLLKGGKKGAPPPEEDDLGLPPEDEGAPPPEGGAPGGGAPPPPMDLAAMMGGGGMPPPPEAGGPPPEGGPEMPPEEGAPGQGMDLDTALGSVESALDGLPPEAAEEIREHLNAIREIAAGGPGGMPQEKEPDASPSPDMGATPPPVSPAKEETEG